MDIAVSFVLFLCVCVCVGGGGGGGDEGHFLPSENHLRKIIFISAHLILMIFVEDD